MTRLSENLTGFLVQYSSVMKKFSALFKKYRLRAEFETISAFSDALAEKGYFYEESIFSHWQKGTRVPASRDVVLKIIGIFNERGAIQTLSEANEFLESAKLGYLTEKEQREFIFNRQTDVPFQVPSEIAHFIGREKILKKIKSEIKSGGILLLHGPPGVGKTALAIKLGHLLRKDYPDGVLWYKVDSTNVMDILLSIARLFGEDISIIKDVEVRASIVRTLLSDKKLLLIFDNVTNEHAHKLLIPNSPTSSIIFTSQENSLTISNKYISIGVTTFNDEETKALFQSIFDKKYVNKYVKQINELSEKLGYLPLALQMAAHYIKQSNQTIESYIQQLSSEPIDLKQMKYEDKNLFRAININFYTLDLQTKSFFITLGIFEGKDFSVEAVAFVNKLSESRSKHLLQNLLDISMLEESDNNRYRLHPLIKIFARKQFNDTSHYLRAAQYYEKLLAKADEKPCLRVLRLEVDNIIYIFKQCYESGYWDQVIIMWNPIEKFLSDNNEIKKLRQLTLAIDTAPRINILQKILILYTALLALYWILLYISDEKTSLWNNLYSLAFALPPLIGGLIGIYRSKVWGFYTSNISKAIFFISAGLFSWACGNLIWVFYYNLFTNITVPYPSLADVGYFPAYLLLLVGVYYLSKATSTKISFKLKPYRLLLLFIPLSIIYFSYYFLFFVVERTFSSGVPLRVFFDIYYPSINIIILSFAVIIFGLSINFLGGKYKLSVFAILFGFVLQYIGEFMFAFTTSQELFFTGNIADLYFTFGLSFLTWGTLSFYLTPKRLILDKV